MPILYFSVCVWLAMQLAPSNANKCPSETGKLFGYRKGDTCYSIIKFPWRIMTAKMAKSPQLATRRACNAMFKEGDRQGFADEKELEFDAAWKANMNEEYWAFGHIFILKTQPPKEVSPNKFCQDMQIIKDVQVLKKNRCYQMSGSEVQLEESDALLENINKKEHHTALIASEVPLCPTYRLSKDGMTHSTVESCEIFFTTNEKAPTHILCKHAPYNSCKWKSESFCHYVAEEDEWYSSIQMITRKSEKPYGKECPIKKASDLGSTCSPACRGNWGEWTKGPTEPHLRCDEVTIFRFKPLDTTSYPCFNASSTCCPEVKIMKYNTSCTDFAYNSTLNLRKNGCKNNGTLAKDGHGHLACHCSDSYSGIQCEIDICAEFCINGGSCVPLMGKPACLCNKGFTGSKCETLTESCGATKPCQNGGTCKETIVLDKVMGICQCLSAYGGSFCELDAATCDDKTCQFNGDCIYDHVYRTVKCICYEGYTGQNCDPIETETTIEKVKAATGIAIYVITGTAVGFAALLLIFGGTAVHHHRRKLRKRRFSIDHRGNSAMSSSYASTRSTAVSTHRTATKKMHKQQSKAVESKAQHKTARKK